MLTQEQHDLIKQAALILKTELESLAPASPDAEEGQIKIHKFGTFKVKRAKARKVENVAAGGQIEIPERIVVRFSPSKTWLKGLV